jgi:LytS/YehU family sensor histidine kinase
LAGLIFRFNKGKLLGIIPAILFGVAIEALYGALTILIVQPYIQAQQIVLNNIPQMMVAVSLGVGISMVIFHTVKEPTYGPMDKTALTRPISAGKSSRWGSKLRS